MTPTTMVRQMSSVSSRSSAVSMIARVEDGVIALLSFAIFTVVLIAVLSRFIFHAPLSWTTEVSVTLMIWLTFLGIAVGVRDRAHVTFELLDDQLTGVWKVLVQCGQVVIMGFLLVVITYGGFNLVKLGMGQTTPAGFPQWISFSALPVGCLLGLAHLVGVAWGVITRPDAREESIGSEVGPC